MYKMREFTGWLQILTRMRLLTSIMYKISRKGAKAQRINKLVMHV